MNNIVNDNVKKTKDALVKEAYYENFIKTILEWARSSKSLSDNVQFEDSFFNIVNNNNLNRLKAYALLSLACEEIENAGFMFEHVDTITDWVYSTLTGNCPDEKIVKFNSDPVDVDLVDYVRSYKWAQ